jgi:thiol-disulfide isomerase/thioredoxin
MWVLVGVLVLASAVGLVWRMRQGRVRDVRAGAGSVSGTRAGLAAGGGGESLIPALADLGHAPGERATLLQFSSAFCAPCRATKRVLADVAALVPGVRHVEVDAESNLELVRRLNILKTPTTLVLDADGRVTKRAAGQPRKEHILAALENAVG